VQECPHLIIPGGCPTPRSANQRPIREKKMATPGKSGILHNHDEKIPGGTTTSSGRQHPPGNYLPDTGGR